MSMFSSILGGWASGGIPGAIGGGMAEGAAQGAANSQRKAIDEAMKRLTAMSQEQYKNRMADLEKTMAFYGPAQQAFAEAYGGTRPVGSGPPATGMPAPAPVAPGGPPATPPMNPPGFPKVPTGQRPPFAPGNERMGRLGFPGGRFG